jgi:hypothetical protein
LALAAAARAADPTEELYACRDGEGTLVYQNDPCDATPPRKPARPAPSDAAVKSKPKAKAAAAAAKTPASSPVPATSVTTTTSTTTPPTKRHSGSFVAKPIRPIIDPSVFSADPKWGSPERTLHTFIGAMKGADRALARSCLMAGALADLGPQIDALPPESLRATVDAYTGFVLEGEVGPYWSIRALRPKTRPKWIFFSRSGDGTWKISAI